MQDLVTIAIPTYNRADGFLADVIAAALSQSWQNIEVLVGDNASTDSTPDLVGAITDPRLRYIRRPENIGANGNFNALLHEARGQWFLLFHDDDMIDHDFVETCMQVAGGNRDLGFVRTGVRAIDKQGKVLKERSNQIQGSTREDFYFSWFNSKIGLYLCNTVFNTAHLQAVGGFNSVHNLLEDNYALVRLLERWDYAATDAIKASYRYTYDQRSYQVPVVQWCQDFRQLLAMITAQCEMQQRERVHKLGRRFFGQLCMRRANMIESAVRRNIARLVVARYFGIRSVLRHGQAEI